ncbi:MAG: hypothetical protein QXU99_00940 [Candidatus Bathyarchaeia archaeon]
MPYLSPKQRLKIALGGFISLIGILILVTVLLAITNTVNIENALPNNLIIAAAVIIGILDIFCGFFLFRKN